MIMQVFYDFFCKKSAVQDFLWQWRLSRIFKMCCNKVQFNVNFEEKYLQKVDFVLYYVRLTRYKPKVSQSPSIRRCRIAEV